MPWRGSAPRSATRSTRRRSPSARSTTYAPTTNSAREALAATKATDGHRERERSEAQAALTRIETQLDAAYHALTSTKAAQTQLAQYSAQRDTCINGVRGATSALQHGETAGAVLALRRAAPPCSAALAAATGARFPYDFPDPSVLNVGSKFYAYSTNSGAGNIQVLYSRDLVHWSIVGDALAALPAWAGPGATWAPAVVARGNLYIAFYTVRERRDRAPMHLARGRGVAAGPFVDLTRAPFVCQVGGSIDPSPFVAADGRAWLLWKGERTPTAPTTIWSQPMSADGLKLTGRPVALLAPGQAWERGVVEGPSMVTIDGRVYLFYSGGYWTTTGYSEGVVTCDGPAGPCRRILPGPALVSQGRLAGPGGGEVITTPRGNVWLAFHAFTQPNLGYPNSRTLHFASVRIVAGIPIVTVT